MSSIHSASLVMSSFHSKDMLELLELDIGSNLIGYLVHATVDTVDFACGSSSSSNFRKHSNFHPDFTEFVSNVVLRSKVTIGVLLVALVYITRSKPHIFIETQDWACERVFLGALILASKYTNDSALKNVQWSLVTGLFGKRDVGRIEREFLDVLDWDLTVSESDILNHHDSIMARFPQARHHRSSSSITKYARPSPVLMEDSSSWSDSDSDDSSPSPSPSPQTPSAPHHQLSFIKHPSPVGDKHNTSRPFYLSHFFSVSWGKHHPVPSPPSLPYIAA